MVSQTRISDTLGCPLPDKVSRKYVALERVATWQMHRVDVGPFASHMLAQRQLTPHCVQFTPLTVPDS